MSKFLVFDLGGTLVNVQKKAPPFKLSFVKNVSKTPIDEQRFDSFEKHFNYLLAEMNKIKSEFEVQIANVLEASLKFFSIELTTSINEAELLLAKENADVMIPPNANRMIEFLSNKQHRFVVLSNSCFSSFALKKMFNALYPNLPLLKMYSSADYLFKKPSPQLFGLILSEYGVCYEETCFMGNSYFDVALPSNMGGESFWINGDANRVTNDKIHLVSSLNDIIDNWKDLL